MLPVLDLSAADTDTAAFRLALREATHTHGFFYLTGHRIPDAQITEILELARQFFALPEAEKNQISQFEKPAFPGLFTSGRRADERARRLARADRHRAATPCATRRAGCASRCGGTAPRDHADATARKITDRFPQFPTNFHIAPYSCPDLWSRRWCDEAAAVVCGHSDVVGHCCRGGCRCFRCRSIRSGTDELRRPGSAWLLARHPCRSPMCSRGVADLSAVQLAGRSGCARNARKLVAPTSPARDLDHCPRPDPAASRLLSAADSWRATDVEKVIRPPRKEA